MWNNLFLTSLKSFFSPRVVTVLLAVVLLLAIYLTGRNQGYQLAQALGMPRWQNSRRHSICYSNSSLKPRTSYYARRRNSTSSR
nr:hypothetical protein PJ912_23145 [Pectobacterium colocasium]